MGFFNEIKGSCILGVDDNNSYLFQFTAMIVSFGYCKIILIHFRFLYQVNLLTMILLKDISGIASYINKFTSEGNQHLPKQQ